MIQLKINIEIINNIKIKNNEVSAVMFLFFIFAFKLRKNEKKLKYAKSIKKMLIMKFVYIMQKKVSEICAETIKWQKKDNKISVHSFLINKINN